MADTERKAVDPVRMAQAMFMVDLARAGFEQVRPIPGGRWAGLYPYMFTVAIVTGKLLDRHELEDRWCYNSRLVADAALSVWNGTGEPNGWIRHPRSGRCRYDADPNREVYDWALEVAGAAE